MAFPEINRVVLVARLTEDPELGELPSGRSVCNLRVASNGIRYDEGEGAYTSRPNFFDVATFGPQAENVAKYMAKGSQVVIDGRLEWSDWIDDNDEPRQGVRIVADSVQFVGQAGSSSTGRGRANPKGRAARSSTTKGRGRQASGTRSGQSSRGRSSRRSS